MTFCTASFATGEYKRDASVAKTLSPSMDICVSSNFERFLFWLHGGYIGERSLARSEATSRLNTKRGNHMGLRTRPVGATT